MPRVSYGYALDRITPLYGEAEKIAANVWREPSTGTWRYFLYIQVRAEDAPACEAWKAAMHMDDRAGKGGAGLAVLRYSGEGSTRRLALAQVREWLLCSFNCCIPRETEYRLERGQTRAFPAPGRW